MEISHTLLLKKKSTLEAMRKDRLPFWHHWRDLGKMYLPRRYIHLATTPESRQSDRRNKSILDSTGTVAARVLASGMMNGITSPSSHWFKLRLAGFGKDEPKEMRVWLDQVESELLKIMAGSNFYNAIAVMYLDLVLFGTSAMLIYEDFKSVIRCFNPALGQFYFAQSNRQQVNTFAREFTFKVHQVVEEFGLENCSEHVKLQYKRGGAHLQGDIKIVHLVEPNIQNERLVAKDFEFRELYWEMASQEKSRILRAKGFHELPGLFPRWDVSGNEAYGGCPAMDALGDVIQLQHETKAKGMSLDKMNDPPIQADIQLQHKPTALMPRGITYVSGLLNSSGAAMRPVYQINPPIAEITQDIQQLRSRIETVFHNDLFKLISNLDTVRSALEVDALKSERLVQLGPVLERFENEALDPGINRTFSIAQRNGLLPPVPEGFEDQEIEIQYESILSTAQRAAGTASTERFFQVIGEVSAIHPSAKNVANFDVLLTEYGRDIGVAATGMNTLEEIEELNAADNAVAQAAQEAEIGNQVAQGAETLSNADVGGGVNALEVLAGGGTI